MIIYTEKYTESDKRIRNNNLLYKIHHKYQNTFQRIPFFRNKSKQIEQFQNIKKLNFLFCYI